MGRLVARPGCGGQDASQQLLPLGCMSGLGIDQRVLPGAPVSVCLHRSHPLPQPGLLHCLCPGPLAPDPPPQHPNGTCEHPSLGMALFFLPPSVAPISLGVNVQVLHLPPTPPHPHCSPFPPELIYQPHGLLAAPQPHPPPRVTPTQGLSLPSSTSPLSPCSPCPAPLFLGGSLLKPQLSERLALTYPSHSAACLNMVSSELLLGPAAVLCFCLLTLQTAGPPGQGSLTGIE